MTPKTFTTSPTAKIDKVEAHVSKAKRKHVRMAAVICSATTLSGCFVLFFSQRKRAERHLGCRLTETPELSCQKSGCRGCSSLKLAFKRHPLPLSMQDKQETLLYGLHFMVNTLKSLSGNCFLSNRRSYTNKMHKKAPEIPAVSSKPHGR